MSEKNSKAYYIGFRKSEELNLTILLRNELLHKHILRVFKRALLIYAQCMMICNMCKLKSNCLPHITVHKV